MIATIIRKEIVSNFLSYKFFIVILLVAILVFTSFFIMYRDYKGRLADFQLIKPKPEEAIAVIPPNPLSIFAKGLEDAMTRSFEVSSIGIDVRAGQQSGNDVFSFFPAPDFVYVVKVVLSLVALLFGFDQVSREKESGTLRLMLANPVSRADVLGGKWLGNYLSLAVPFLLVTLLGLAIMSLDPGIHFGAAALARLGILILISLVYVALFLSLGIFVSALTRKAASSLVILLFLWSLLVFVFPNMGTLLARQMVDVPSVRALNEKRQQIWTREILLSYSDRGNRAVHIKTINEELDRMEEDYRSRFDRLVRLSKNINRLSPAASFVYSSTELAGTGIGEESRLKKDIIRYKDTVRQDLDRDKKEHESYVFRYRSLGLVLADGSLFDIAWLIVFNILFFLWGYLAMVRYDVR